MASLVTVEIEYNGISVKRLSDQIVNDVAMDIRKSEITSLVSIR